MHQIKHYAVCDKMHASSDNEIYLEYYAQVLQDIKDIKARTWNFLTVLIAISGGILAIRDENIARLRLPLMLGFMIAAISTIYISIDSFLDIQKKRENITKIYNKVPESREISGAKNNKETIKYRRGDYAFLFFGTVSPIVLFWMILCVTCPWSVLCGQQ